MNCAKAKKNTEKKNKRNEEKCVINVCNGETINSMNHYYHFGKLSSSHIIFVHLNAIVTFQSKIK